MDKKDIYEHLAKIYLDASSKKKKKSQGYPQLFRNLFFISILLTLGLGVFLFAGLHKNKSLNFELALVLVTDAAKINFNFNPAKKETYSLNLNKLNLSRFKILAFSLKKRNYKDTISLRIEFSDAFNEKSEIYIKNISHKWQDYKINLSEFKSIHNWSQLKELAFIVEEWNTKEKNGIIYIDNLRFLR